MNDTTVRPDSAPVGGKPRRTNQALLWGALLVVAGIITFIANLGLFSNVAEFIVAAAFGAGGLVFLYFFLRDTQGSWWAAIPSGALLSLAGTIMVAEYAPASTRFLSGAVFLGGLALGFLAVYVVRRDMWWALIPGGVLASLASMAAINDSGMRWGNDIGGGLLFLGMGVTFLLVALAPDEHGKGRWWAFIPAAILLVIGALVLASYTAALESMGFVWGALLVIGGGFLLWRSLSKQDE